MTIAARIAHALSRMCRTNTPTTNSTNATMPTVIAKPAPKATSATAGSVSARPPCQVLVDGVSELLTRKLNETTSGWVVTASVTAKLRVAAKALIQLLFSLRRPSAITWLVVAVVVDAVDRVIGRRFLPHVGIERLERIAPAVAHANAASAVVVKGVIVSVVAPHLHPDPSAILNGFFHAVRASWVITERISTKATTALSQAVAKIPTWNYSRLSTLASHMPSRLATVWMFWRSPSDREPSEHKASKVDQLAAHRAAYFTVFHAYLGVK